MSQRYRSPFDNLRRPQPDRLTRLHDIEPGVASLYKMGAKVIDLITAG